MNIIITGANGQLGNELRILSTQYPDNHFIFTDIEELDITNKDAFENFIESNPCDVLINAAAYTAVDKAETEKEKAFEINVNAVKNIALVSQKYNFFPIHISTDYVFDGMNFKPYNEEDITNPVSFYGQTKLEGEKEFLQTVEQGVIIRTSWLYSSFGNNFVKTMLRLSSERPFIQVVFDQIGSPTYAADLAEVVLKIAFNHQKINTTEIYHFSNEGVASWFDLAKEIMQYIHANTEIQPIETKDYPTPAKRPFYSVFNKQKIKKDFNLYIPYWKDSLYRCLDKIACKQ